MHNLSTMVFYAVQKLFSKFKELFKWLRVSAKKYIIIKLLYY